MGGWGLNGASQKGCLGRSIFRLGNRHKNSALYRTSPSAYLFGEKALPQASARASADFGSVLDPILGTTLWSTTGIPSACGLIALNLTPVPTM